MNRGLLYYLMVPILIGAALLQSTALVRVAISGVKPDLVLLLVIIATLLYGSRPGIVWAFVGGLALDIFSGGPLGTSSLALMAAALVAGVGHHTLSRYNVLVSLGACALGTLAYSLTYVGILAALNGAEVWSSQLPLLPTLQYIVIPALLYNGALMLIALPLLNRVPEIPQG